MSDLREDFYAFRKQMREVFIRVEDMVDVHRSFFKSDPSTGSPVFNEDLEQEAEQLASQTFEQLAHLRKQFTKLASDFQRSGKPSDDWPRRDRDHTKIRASTTKALTRFDRAQPPTSSHGLDADEGISVKGPAISEDGGSDRDSSDERPIEHSPRIPLTRRSSHANSDDDVPAATMPDSARSTTSTYISSQLQSRWGNSGESTAASDISTHISRSHGRSLSIVSDASSLPDQCSRPNELQTESIFQDFDKRMEEIRNSLNAIASGKKPHRSSSSDKAARVAASSPKIFTRGDAASPVGAMMDAVRTRSTLREASRISTADLDVESSTGSEGKPPRGAREAELRHLLQQLNQLNGDNDADD
ncbi:40S ribosomal protein S19-1 [Phytophthora cinnamomi]|uniref:40S ribosomal protein S19-1 n=1 Tax=Phytophthora cinnamomi TaxID=4785 RepID=UPI003559827C|nr:40S ribosomal protein S19-1 [Phytophthora cinnamomi]